MRLGDLKKRGNQYYYRDRWWSPNKPVPSSRSTAKWMVMSVHKGMFTPRSYRYKPTDAFSIIHWGDPSMSDYISHGDQRRRDNYRARAKGIRGGRYLYAHLDPRQKNHWAVHATWPLGRPTVPRHGEKRVLAGCSQSQP